MTSPPPVEWPDVNGVLQVEMGSDRREVVGIVIHVVTVADLRLDRPWPRRSWAIDAIAVAEGRTASACPNHRPTAANRGGIRWAGPCPSPCRKSQRRLSW